MKKNLFGSIELITLFCLSFNCFGQTLETDLKKAATHEKKSRFSTKAIDRPGVLPQGIVSIESTTQLTALKTVGLDASIVYGFTDNFQAGLSYDGVEFNKTKVSHVARLNAKYNFNGLNHFSPGLSLSIPIHIAEKDSKIKRDVEIVEDLTIGAPLVFYIDNFAGGLFSDLLHITMRPYPQIEIPFKLWVGYQIYGNLWADISTTLGAVRMTNNRGQAKWNKSKGFWQEMPVRLTALYGISEYFDIGGFFGFSDVFKGKSAMEFGISLGVRAGRLFG